MMLKKTKKKPIQVRWMRMFRFSSYLIALITFVSACSTEQQSPLKIYSKRTVNAAGDSVYQKLPPFSFTNQRGETVTNATVENKVYVADFFFTSCPTICPRMKAQMLRVYEKYGNEPDFVILSHSIDPGYDTVALLADFARKLNAYEGNWHFLTGDKTEIYDMAEHYMVTAMEDKDAPGGYAHSGAFILVDKNGLVRGYYDGTVEQEVNQIMEDIQILLNEKER